MARYARIEVTLEVDDDTDPDGSAFYDEVMDKLMELGDFKEGPDVKEVQG